MNIREINEWLSLKPSKTRDLLKKKIMVASTRVRKDYSTGKEMGIIITATVQGGPLMGEIINFETAVDESTKSLVRGDFTIINAINGENAIRLRATTSNESTYVDFGLTIFGKVTLLEGKK